MDYINTGLIIGSISTIVFLILTLKKRWFDDSALEDLYLWWDGKKHDGGDLIFSITIGFFSVILAPLLISLTWAHVNDINNGAKITEKNPIVIENIKSPPSCFLPSHQRYRSSNALSSNHLFLSVSIKNTIVDILPIINPVFI